MALIATDLLQIPGLVSSDNLNSGSYVQQASNKYHIPKQDIASATANTSSYARQLGFDLQSAQNLAYNTFDTAWQLQQQYGQQAVDVNDKLTEAWLKGSDAAREYGVVVDDLTLTGFMAEQGVDIANMQITDAQRAAYRYQLMQEQLATSSDETLADNIQRWKQLGMQIDSTKGKLFQFDEVINLGGLDTTIPDIVKTEPQVADRNDGSNLGSNLTLDNILLPWWFRGNNPTPSPSGSPVANPQAVAQPQVVANPQVVATPQAVETKSIFQSVWDSIVGFSQEALEIITSGLSSFLKSPIIIGVRDFFLETIPQALDSAKQGLDNFFTQTIPNGIQQLLDIVMPILDPLGITRGITSKQTQNQMYQATSDGVKLVDTGGVEQRIGTGINWLGGQNPDATIMSDLRDSVESLILAFTNSDKTNTYGLQGEQLRENLFTEIGSMLNPTEMGQAIQVALAAGVIGSSATAVIQNIPAITQSLGTVATGMGTLAPDIATGVQSKLSGVLSRLSSLIPQAYNTGKAAGASQALQNSLRVVTGGKAASSLSSASSGLSSSLQVVTGGALQSLKQAAGFASGGIGTREINNATLFEGNKAEAVIPLEQEAGIRYLASALEKASQGSGAISGGGSYNIHLNMSGIFDTDDQFKWDQLADKLATRIALLNQRRGSLDYGATY